MRTARERIAALEARVEALEASQDGTTDAAVAKLEAQLWVCEEALRSIDTPKAREALATLERV